MRTASEPTTPQAEKRRNLLVIRLAGVVVLGGATALSWNDLPVLGAAAGGVVSLVAAACYVVEARYSRALERRLAQRSD